MDILDTKNITGKKTKDQFCRDFMIRQFPEILAIR